MPCLLIQVPDHGEETHILSGERVTIGRRPENTIQILHSSVSAFHAELVEVHGHYHLRDLKSTNRSFVAGEQIAEYHLRERCKVSFGSVHCEYDPKPLPEPAPRAMSPAQLEQDLTFLRSENADLREKIRALERQIDILGSAQIFGEKRSRQPEARTDSRDRTAAIEAELEQTREELAIAIRARDAARTAAGMLHLEKTSILREIRSHELQRQCVTLK
jgi:hypothetical protein